MHVAMPRALGLPDDLDLLVSGVADQSSSRPARVVEAPDGLRRAILEGRFRALEPWSRLRPDLPKGTGYVAVRTKGGT